MRTGEQWKFEIPTCLNAASPAERRGIRRDQVKLMVTDRQTGAVAHTHFHKLEDYLRAGDLLVLNTSRTVPALLQATWRREDVLLQVSVEIRLTSRRDDSSWNVIILANDIQIGDRLTISPTLYATVMAAAAESPYTILQFNVGGDELVMKSTRLDSRCITNMFIKLIT